jgi:hypothetical protein
VKKKHSSQNLTIYLGTDQQRFRRIAAIDRLARGRVPEEYVRRPGSERSVLFQMLADNEDAAGQALDLFMTLIGYGKEDPPPPVIVWNGRQWTISATALED